MTDACAGLCACLRVCVRAHGPWMGLSGPTPPNLTPPRNSCFPCHPQGFFSAEEENINFKGCENADLSQNHLPPSTSTPTPKSFRQVYFLCITFLATGNPGSHTLKPSLRLLPFPLPCLSLCSPPLQSTGHCWRIRKNCIIH